LCTEADLDLFTIGSIDDDSPQHVFLCGSDALDNSHGASPNEMATPLRAPPHDYASTKRRRFGSTSTLNGQMTALRPCTSSRCCHCSAASLRPSGTGTSRPENSRTCPIPNSVT